MIVWPKFSTPLTVVALKNNLNPIWKDFNRWGITSLGKGSYELSFSTLGDVRRVRSVASWNLQPGHLKLIAWTRDFNPNMQKNTNSQVWVRIYGLAQEYWRPKILFPVASSIGILICTYVIGTKTLFEITFGHYVRVLVDIDLTQPLRNKFLVERQGYAFFVKDVKKVKEKAKQKPNLNSEATFVQVRDGRKVGETSNVRNEETLNRDIPDEPITLAENDCIPGLDKNDPIVQARTDNMFDSLNTINNDTDSC
ncbi:uncharacterized protein LOC131658979 [Vicia villosa]|uniref:uncharacterized protein LOC131658979 n=1 Tax=Vicia villosa TaxID=3911 RepID=UPI00273C14B1|nr:uncharacterized protein LOC131658979 [Vicia villosa]